MVELENHKLFTVIHVVYVIVMKKDGLEKE